VSAVLLDGLDRLLEVAGVVQRVEDAEDVHAVLARERDEPLQHVVRIVLVAENVLAAQQHLQRGLLADRLQLAQALPGILAQKAQADVERRAAPALQRVVARVVHLLGDREDVVRTHAGRPQRLMRIAERGVGDADTRFRGSHGRGGFFGVSFFHKRLFLLCLLMGDKNERLF
jgi:nucleotide-binding universal stress UspA family protein